MSILVNGRTRLLVHGVNTPQGAAYLERMDAYGTPIVSAVAVGQGGSWRGQVPVFETVKEAMHATDPNAALICVHPEDAIEAILETAAAGIDLVVCATSRVPVHDVVQVRSYLRARNVRLLGPGSPGVFTPGVCVVGAVAPGVLLPGSVGVLSRSGTLAYEVVSLLTEAGIGQSTVVGIGDGLIVGTGFVDLLAMFEDDPATQQVVLLGEIGGYEEEMSADWIRDRMSKPVVALVVGQIAPPGRRMGHPGAIIEGYDGLAKVKVEALSKAGARIARAPSEIPRLLEEA
ncbi:MAG: succinate--CoA ligase subunit alpha [Anaerolineae bacterium]|nr:succinate--CoA ligase subunit alpha [Anaerolineae bacterium]